MRTYTGEMPRKMIHGEPMNPVKISTHSPQPPYHGWVANILFPLTNDSVLIGHSEYFSAEELLILALQERYGASLEE